ncbi:hypothetical protein [Massilia sp.]|uniref:hypothetical protein n=1 Tax=Massilia sp. TaxID=1882437 RepID=UPI00289BFF7D|nr:hypothetical protein [Massilia sp.]
MKTVQWLVGGLLGVGFVHAASASWPEPPVPDAARVTRVTVLLTPPGLRFSMPLTYARLETFACRFGTSFRPDRQAALVDIMERHLLHSSSSGFSRASLRNAVELHMDDGSILRYTFDDDSATDGAIDGWRDRKGATGGRRYGSSMPVIGTRGFLRELRTWAAGDVGRVNFDPKCLREPQSSDAHKTKRALTGPSR